MIPVSIRKNIGLPATSRVNLGLEEGIAMKAMGPRYPQSSVARPRRLGRLRSHCFDIREKRCNPLLMGVGHSHLFFHSVDTDLEENED